MAFTAKNKKTTDFTDVLPLWVEDLKSKCPELQAGFLLKGEKFEDWPNVILTFPGQCSASMAKEKCGKAIQSFWADWQIIYRFKQFNEPRCKKSQHEILKKFDPTHREEICNECKPRYGCKRSVFTTTQGANN
jgi:hypothetical protein